LSSSTFLAHQAHFINFATVLLVIMMVCLLFLLSRRQLVLESSFLHQLVFASTFEEL
jgi:hypothetical protein